MLEESSRDSHSARGDEAAKALRESEVKYRTLFEAAGDAIALMELTGSGPVLCDCNARALEMFGRTRDEILGLSPADPALSAPIQSDGRTSEDMAAQVVQAALGGSPQSFEWTH